MRITLGVSGYFDWVTVPPGTEIRKDDVENLLVKQMADDSWRMRVEIERETHHDIGIPEDAIVRELCAQHAIGNSPSRADVVSEMVKKNIVHHVDRERILGVEVHDDGPNLDMFAELAAAAGLKTTRNAKARTRYTKDVDMAAYLKTVLVDG